MQAQDRGATEKRALYHWARVYRDGINQGDEFCELVACRVIFFLNFNIGATTRLHGVFKVLELHEHTVFSDELELHIVQLPRLLDGVITPKNSKVVKWAQFLTVQSAEERKRLGMEDRNIQRANDALEKLSQDPKVRELARWREDQLRLYRMELLTAERRGEQIGEQIGEVRGEHKMAVEMLRSLLIQKFGALPPSHEDALEEASIDTLKDWAGRIFTINSVEELFEAIKE